MFSKNSRAVFIPQSIDFAKSKAKLFRKLVHPTQISLGAAQQITAIAMGHDDWHDLEEALKQNRPATTLGELVYRRAEFSDIQRDALSGTAFEPKSPELLRAWNVYGVPFDVRSGRTRENSPSPEFPVEMPMPGGCSLAVRREIWEHSYSDLITVTNISAHFHGPDGYQVGTALAKLFRVERPVSSTEFREVASQFGRVDLAMAQDLHQLAPNFTDALFDGGLLYCYDVCLYSDYQGKGLLEPILRALMRYCEVTSGGLSTLVVNVAPQGHPSHGQLFSLPQSVQQEVADMSRKFEKHVHQVVNSLDKPTFRYTVNDAMRGNARRVRKPQSNIPVANQA